MTFAQFDDFEDPRSHATAAQPDPAPVEAPPADAPHTGPVVRWGAGDPAAPVARETGAPLQPAAPSFDLPAANPFAAAAPEPLSWDAVSAPAPTAGSNPFASDVAPAGPADLPDLFADALPAVPADGSAGETVPSDMFADLFGTDAASAEPAPETHNLPEAAPEVAHASGDGEEGAASDAMAAWRRMREGTHPGPTESLPALLDPSAHSPAVPDPGRSSAPQPAPRQAPAVLSVDDTALARRYNSVHRLADLVDSIRGLASTSGSPELVSRINDLTLTNDMALDAQQRATYEQIIAPVMQANRVVVDNPDDWPVALDMAYDETIGLGPIGPLWRDPSVTEIIISGPYNVSCERDGNLIQTPVQFRDLDHLVSIARDLARKFDDRVVSRSMPVVGAQLPGARVQFVAAPVAPNAGMSVTIRKFRALFGIEELLDFGALTPDMASLLSDAVTARANILVSGGTGSGKTTMINSLSAFIPDSERVITIEDALELSLTNTFVESLLTKEASSGDDTVIIGQPELLRATLRMRPDRVIVGEIRDSGGCAVMLQAANTGHDGTMTTVHANDPDRALRRLSLLLRGSSDGMSDDVADEEVRSAFDLVVQVVRHHGRRFVSHISMVNKTSPGTTTLFEGHYTRGMAAPAFQRVGGMGSDTELAMRFANAGLNTDTWE